MGLTNVPLAFHVSSPSLMEAVPVPTDSALMARALAGDEQAIGLLYDAHSTVVYSIALGILGSPESAEDVLHDTFMQLWREPASFALRGETLKASLAISAYNGAVSARKRRSVKLSSAGSIHEASANR